MIDEPEQVMLTTAMADLTRWYEENQANVSASEREVIAYAGIIVAERFRSNFPIPRSSYWTGGNRGAWTAAQVQKILRKHGENRRILSEAGRTTGSSPAIAHELAVAINGRSEIASYTVSQRAALADEIQQRLVERVSEIFDQRQRLALSIDADLATKALIGSVLSQAGRHRGAVAQHLVGAKLELRHRTAAITIDNHPYTAADVQTERSGDFAVGRYVFHVTIAPSARLFEKCKENVRGGARPYVLVPEDKVSRASELARQNGIQSRVTVDSIESFVGRNLDEIAADRGIDIEPALLDLFETYNRRAEVVESEVAVLLDIPEFLRRSGT